MTSARAIRVFLAAGLASVSGIRGAVAVCTEFGGFAVFQCANLAYFEPPPFPLIVDPNGRPTNVTAVFWQVGFGNNGVNTGLSGTGTGMTGPATFNGNDNGAFAADIVEATQVSPLFPANALCLRSNNWANSGIDGCCDNPRDPGP